MNGWNQEKAVSLRFSSLIYLSVARRKSQEKAEKLSQHKAIKSRFVEREKSYELLSRWKFNRLCYDFEYKLS